MAFIGRYEIISELGRGGMGIVYLANDPKLNRKVAIKKLLQPESDDKQAWDDMVRRFNREARTAASLSHPHLVAVYDVPDDWSPPGIVMEFVKGKTLANTVPLGNCASATFTIGVLRQCASALDYAHSRGVVHRDVKPMNIMLDEAGSVKIVDFGIAKLLTSNTDLTHGQALGTLQYMSREQLQGARVTGATDQYSLAVVAYHILTGCPIFEAHTPGEWVALILTGKPILASRRNPALPPPVDAVLGRALIEAPDARYRTCTEFVEELEQALTPAPQTRRPTLEQVKLDTADQSNAWRERTADSAPIEENVMVRERVLDVPSMANSESATTELVEAPSKKSHGWLVVAGFGMIAAISLIFLVLLIVPHPHSGVTKTIDSGSSFRKKALSKITPVPPLANTGTTHTNSRQSPNATSGLVAASKTVVGQSTNGAKQASPLVARPKSTANWFMQFQEQSKVHACERAANEPDLKGSTVVECDDYYRGQPVFWIRLGPVNDRAELDRIRNRYLQKGVFSVMLRHEECFSSVVRVDCSTAAR